MLACKMSWRRGVAAVLLLMVPICIGFPGAWALESDSGTLLGVITTADGGGVHAGAVVQVRNTVTGEIYKSSPADELGMYVSRDVPYGTYDLAVETTEGYFLTSDQVAVKNTVPQVISLALSEDEGAASAKKAAVWWKSPVGIVLISAATVATGLVVAEQLEDDPAPESPANP